MVPADSNHVLAEGMLNELASAVPPFARELFKRLTICTMDERMRVAMKYVHRYIREWCSLLDVNVVFVGYKRSRACCIPSSVPAQHFYVSPVAIYSHRALTRTVSCQSSHPLGPRLITI